MKQEDFIDKYGNKKSTDVIYNWLTSVPDDDSLKLKLKNTIPLEISKELQEEALDRADRWAEENEFLEQG